MKDIKGYKILNINLNGIRHHVLFKKHESNKSDDRSIFLCNLPIATDFKILKKIFEKHSIGATIEKFTNSYLTDSIEDIVIDLPSLTSDLKEPEVNESFKLPKNCGVLTFIDKAAFQLAFTNLNKLSNKEEIIDWPINNNSFGSSYFLNQYQSQILDIQDLSNDVNQSLIDFDQAEKESMESFQNQKQLVDEDGFTLVVGYQRKTKAGILGNQQQLKNKLNSEKVQKKEKTKEKEDFYRFQLRQRKKDEMNDLLRKFKADQEKVQQMKEKKRFRPY